MDLIEKAARAAFAVMNPQAACHELTDYDSAWANQRGDYLGAPTQSLVDQAAEVARAVIASLNIEKGV